MPAYDVLSHSSSNKNSITPDLENSLEGLWEQDSYHPGKDQAIDLELKSTVALLQIWLKLTTNTICHVWGQGYMGTQQYYQQSLSPPKTSPAALDRGSLELDKLTKQNTEGQI